MASPCYAPDQHMPRPDGWVSSNLDDAIRSLARTGAPFTSDDLWGDTFGFGDGPDAEGKLSNVKPSEVGPAFMRAHHRNVVRLIGYKTSQRKSRHGGLVRVWIGSDGAYL